MHTEFHLPFVKEGVCVCVHACKTGRCACVYWTQIQGYWGNQKKEWQKISWGFFITDSSPAAVKSHSPYFNTLLCRCVCFSICLAKATAVWWYIGCWIPHVCVCICAGSSERMDLDYICKAWAEVKVWMRCSVLSVNGTGAWCSSECKRSVSFVSNSSHINAARPFSCTGLWMIRHQRKLAPCYARMCLRVSWNVFCECYRCFRHHGRVVDGWLNPTCTLQYYGIVFFFVADTLWQWFSVGFWWCVGNLKLEKNILFFKSNS